jgi:hypothetical protein
MSTGIGILITERIALAAVSGHSITGALRVSPEDADITDSLHGVPAETIVQRLAEQVQQLGLKETPTHIGMGMPGIVRNGVVEDSPNLIQFKGLNMQELVSNTFAPIFGKVPVSVYNDAGGNSGDPRPFRPADSRLDTGHRHWVWPLSVSRRVLGGGSFGCHAGY